MANAAVLKTASRKGIRVRVPSSAVCILGVSTPRPPTKGAPLDPLRGLLAASPDPPLALHALTNRADSSHGDSLG
jgi:hypothetical protein